jgi:regulator of protease activity HflC (stomatin/prohibitin superfamily)
MGCCCSSVEEANVGIVERFGRFSHVILPGFNCINCCTESVVGELPLKITKYDLSIETRTKDNVFVTLKLALIIKVAESTDEFSNYKPSDSEEGKGKEKVKAADRVDLVNHGNRHSHIDPQIIYNAYYKLKDPVTQISSHIEQYFRFHGMEYTLDDMYATRENMTAHLKEEINGKMNQYGYVIHNILVMDIIPAIEVVKAMNDVVATQKERIAQTNRAEAEKITRIMAAEAEAKTRELQGVGIAAERRKIIEGMQQSVEDFHKALPDSNPHELVNLILMTQYLDTLKTAAGNSHNTFILPATPAHVNSIGEQIREALLSTPPNKMNIKQ